MCGLRFRWHRNGTRALWAIGGEGAVRIASARGLRNTSYGNCPRPRVQLMFLRPIHCVTFSVLRRLCNPHCGVFNPQKSDPHAIIFSFAAVAVLVRRPKTRLPLLFLPLYSSPSLSATTPSLAFSLSRSSPPAITSSAFRLCDRYSAAYKNTATAARCLPSKGRRGQLP